MKFEQTRVSLVPRSAANCLDLALMFCGRNLGAVVGLWALFAVPLSTAAYLIARFTDWGFAAALCLGLFGSGAFGAMLIGGAARAAFGEPFRLSRMLANLKTDWLTIAQVLGLRFPIGLGFGFCGIPGALMAIWWSFLVESRILTRLHEQRYDRRTNELVKMEFPDLIIRGAMIVLAGILLWVILELTADVAWTILFSRSLFFGRLSELGSILHDEVDFEVYFEHLWRLATSDPAVVALHLATGLAAYAVCRLAWFLCYIDLRVRCDCWDLELEILDESQRLSTTG